MPMFARFARLGPRVCLSPVWRDRLGCVTSHSITLYVHCSFKCGTLPNRLCLVPDNATWQMCCEVEECAIAVFVEDEASCYLKSEKAKAVQHLVKADKTRTYMIETRRGEGYSSAWRWLRRRMRNEVNAL